jgi:putative oxidoreductase
MLGRDLQVCERYSFALLTLRLILGTVLFLHGAQKVFGWFGGSGITGWTNYITGLKMPFMNRNYPGWLAKSAAYVEMLAGIAILLGLGVRVAAVFSIVFLAFAIYIVHWEKGFFIQNSGYEYALTLILLSVVLLVCGGGRYELYKL